MSRREGLILYWGFKVLLMKKGEGGGGGGAAKQQVGTMNVHGGTNKPSRKHEKFWLFISNISGKNASC